MIPSPMWEEVPCVPLGRFFRPAVMRDAVTGVQDGSFPILRNACKG